MTDDDPYDIELTRVFDAAARARVQGVHRSTPIRPLVRPGRVPGARDAVELDARVGGRQRFVMVSDADPAMRTTFDGHFTEVTNGVCLACSGAWDGIPGQADPWPSNMRVEFHGEGDRTRVVLREGPHPPGTADLGRQAWEMMFTKLDSVLRD